MNKNIKIVVIVGISVFLSIQVQAMQRTRERVLKKQEMARLFPQVRTAELAAQAPTSPNARNMFFMELIYEGMLENNREKVQNTLEQGLRQGFDVNFKDNRGNTLLHYAVFTHNNDPSNTIISLLIAHGADVNSKNNTNQTPLYGVAIKNNVEAAKQLIEGGASVNVKDNANWGPLEHAIAHGSIPVVQLLLKTPGINTDREEITKALNQRKEYMKFLADRKELSPDKVEEITKLTKILAPRLMTLAGLSIDTLVKNIDLYQDKLHLLPQELQEEVNRRLAQQ